MNIILITGGLGFIGGHFLKKIKGNTSFEKIIVFDKMTYASNYKRLKNIFEIKIFCLSKETSQTKMMSSGCLKTQA